MQSAKDFFAPSLILHKLTRAIGHGVTLASVAVVATCAENDSNDTSPRSSSSADAMSSDATSDGSSAPDVTDSNATGPGDARPEDSSLPDSLEPYPLSDLGCWGPEFEGGYFGQCCVSAHCYTPEGRAGCVSADFARSVLPEFPPGSGTCSCALGEDAGASWSGPFAPNPADTPRTAGECCYLVGSIECVGRPLMVEGKPLVADLAVRRDWAPFA